MRLRWAAPTALPVTLLLLTSCGGSTTPNPTPAISSIAPDSIAATLVGAPACSGNPSFTINILGSNFISTSVASWNGSTRATTFNANTEQLTVTILACDISQPGSAFISVTNPPPGGGPAPNAATFQITQPPNPSPSISSLSPASTSVGVLPTNGTLTIIGPGPAAGSSSPAFISTSVVAFNGSIRASTFVSATELQVQMLASDVAAVGTINVTVSNPTPGGGTAHAQFAVTGPPNAAAFPQVVSVNSAGGPANGASSSPAISADGRYVAFYSEARNLVASGSSGNIFVRDTCLGAANCTPDTIAADLAPDGSAPDAPAGTSVQGDVAISADGRFVGFVSWASNLVSGGTASVPRVQSVFVRDLCEGNAVPSSCTPHTELVSTGSNGEPVRGDYPALSADGRFVAFTASDDGFVSDNSTTGRFVFVRDTCNGVAAGTECTPRSVLASVEGEAPIGADANAQPSISQDGRYVAFAGQGADTRSPRGTNLSQIYLRDTCWGANAPTTCAPSTTRVSVSPDGAFGNAGSRSPSVSQDGRFVTFQSGASNLAVSSDGRQDVYLRDTCLGPTATADCSASTRRISIDTAPLARSAGNYSPAISASGRYISFSAERVDDDPEFDAQGLGYLVVYDTCFGATGACSPQSTQVAVPDASANPVPLAAEIHMPVPLTPDGSLAAFFSTSAVVAAPKSGLGDVFLTVTSF